MAAGVGLTAVFTESERAVVVLAVIIFGIAVFLFAVAEVVFPH